MVGFALGKPRKPRGIFEKFLAISELFSSQDKPRIESSRLKNIYGYPLNHHFLQSDKCFGEHVNRQHAHFLSVFSKNTVPQNPLGHQNAVDFHLLKRQFWGVTPPSSHPNIISVKCFVSHLQFGYTSPHFMMIQTILNHHV